MATNEAWPSCVGLVKYRSKQTGNQNHLHALLVLIGRQEYTPTSDAPCNGFVRLIISKCLF